jgi:hypothetical protein
MILKDLRFILTLSCDGASRIISDQLDRELTFTERTALRLHTLGCRSCPRFMRQLWQLRTLVRQREISLAESIRNEGIKLSAKAQTRMRQALHQAFQTNND